MTVIETSGLVAIAGIAIFTVVCLRRAHARLNKELNATRTLLTERRAGLEAVRKAVSRCADCRAALDAAHDAHDAGPYYFGKASITAGREAERILADIGGMQERRHA